MSGGVSKYDRGHANLLSFLVSDWTAKLDFSAPAHTIKLSLIPIIVSWPASWDVFMDSLQIIMCQTGHCGRLLCGLRSCLCSYLVSESSAVQQKTVWRILSEKFTTEVHSFGLRTESVCMCCCCSDMSATETKWKKCENLKTVTAELPAELRSFPNRSVLDRHSVSYTPSTTQTDMLHFSCLIYKTKPPSLCFIAATELVVCYSDMKVLALHESEVVTLIDPHHHVVLKHTQHLTLSLNHTCKIKLISTMEDNSNPRLWDTYTSYKVTPRCL